MMQLPITQYANVLVLQPEGRITYLNALDFEILLAPYIARCKQLAHPLLLDLQNLEYISSAGLRIFMLASKQLLPNGIKIAVANPQSIVREILEISRFNLILPIYPSIADALNALSANAHAEYEKSRLGND
ncbi:unnamed protein product [Rotaria magnacalcarata]|uniref:STAS domain-containing protein n=1 Tax=Rotaria magnacalcarata TaxID=392030 RepID=A0A819P4K7_9BILA|nr:unnamed protein product [Rotaria magnacalcarata]